MSTQSSHPFGTLLRRYRLAAGLTQEALAERARLSVAAIYTLERGSRRVPRKATLVLLAEALALTASERATLEATARQGVLATSPTPERGIFLPLTGSSSWPLVGRVQELAVLERHLAGEGPPVLLLAGEPGIGKSRLLQETTQRAAERGWIVLESGCQRRRGQEPYAPLVGALEGRIQHSSRARLRTELDGCAWLVRLLPELAETTLVPAPSWTLPPEQERRLMFSAVRRFLANVAGPAGTLLVLDDLQWAGADALELLVTLLRAPASAPLRVLGAYRSTEVRPRDPLGVTLADLAASGLATQQQVGPLARDEANDLLQRMLAGEQAPDIERTEQVLVRTGGVPFFLVSCVEALRGGILASEDEAVPWTVAQSIRQRVASLSQAAQDLLGVAAVIGRRMERKVLITAAAPSGQEEGARLRTLEEVGQAHLLIEAGADAYQFPHDLIREAVLADLSAARRALLHQQVAEALEQQPGELPVERLAYHYSRAGNTEHAVRYLEQAGDHEWALHANTEAESAYRGLLALQERVGRLEEMARAGEKLGKVLDTLSRYEEALDVLERAVERYERVGDLEGERRTLAALAKPAVMCGKAQDGIARLLPLVEASAEQEPTSGLVLLQASLAWLYQQTGHYQEALVVAEHALARARVLEDPRVLVQAQHIYGLALLELDRVDEAAPVLEAQVKLAETVGELWMQSVDLSNLAVVYVSRGDFARSRQQGARAVEVAEQLGDPGLIANAWIGLSNTSFAAGEWGQSRRDLERAVQTGLQVNAALVISFPLLVLGRIALAEGHWEEATRLLNEARTCGARGIEYILAERELLEGHPEAARALLEPLRDQGGKEPFPRHLLAWAILELGQETEAEVLVEESLGRATLFHDFDWWLDPHLIEALLRSRQGRYEEAQRALEQAIATYRHMPDAYGRAKALSFSGLVQVQQGDTTRAREQLKAALTLLQKLGERLYAEQIERLLARLER